MCSGVCPGVCRTVIQTLPSSSTSPSRTPRNGKLAAASANRHVLGAGCFSESPTRGDVVGVKMRVDDVANAHSRRVRRR